jgi:hypothetical protein
MVSLSDNEAISIGVTFSTKNYKNNQQYNDHWGKNSLN